MNTLSINDFKAMIALALSNIKERENEFSELDAVTGDGDHGTAIVTALTSINETAQQGSEFKAMLSDMGFNVMLSTSGSTSTLLGSFFLGMSDAAEGTELETDVVKSMFESGLSNIKQNTKAVVGDKTMMDALIPAVEAIVACNSDNISEIMDAGAEAALKGAAATVDMKANFGRARNYGERSIGSLDAGATSWACMFDSFAKALAK